jgi:hypothetical protein
LKVQGVKLRVFEDQGGYFKTDGNSGGSCEIIPFFFKGFGCLDEKCFLYFSMFDMIGQTENISVDLKNL